MNVLDYIVLGVMVILVLLTGWLSSRREKSSSEFLMAGTGINKLQAGFSMAATDFGGSGLVGAMGYCYLVGMSGIWWNLSAAPAFFLVGLFLAERIYKMNSATVPEYLEKRYSPAVSRFATLMHVFTNFANLSVQFTIACTTLYSITGISINLSLFICVVLVILLTSGGLRSVVNTDAVLFVIIVLSVTALLVAMPVQESLSAKLSPEKLSLGELGFWTPFSWFILCVLSYSTNQNYIQRMTAAKSEGTARFGALFTAGFYCLISVAIGLIGICASVELPGITDTNMIFAEALKAFLPHGIIGLGMAGLFAATISTGTSILHATTTLIVNDLWKPAAKTEDEKKLVRVSRIILLAIALTSTVISLFSSNIIDVIYVAGLFYGVAVFLPLILGLASRRVTAGVALVSMIAAVGASLVWEYDFVKKIPVLQQLPSNVVGLAVSGAVLCLCIFFQKRTCSRKADS